MSMISYDMSFVMRKPVFSELLTSCNTNWAVQAQKMVRVLINTMDFRRKQIILCMKQNPGAKQMC